MKNVFDKQPTNLYEAVDILISSLDDKELEEVKQHDPAEYHFGFGRSMRNNWGLWQKDSPLATWFRDNLGLGHADDMSGVILEMAFRKVKDLPVDINWLCAKVNYYKNYWTRLGVDALTQEKFGPEYYIKENK
jgi:hypothetical protein